MVKLINNVSTPSILSIIRKLRSLLTREEKLRWVGIVGFAICISLLEVITASLIVIFAQVLSQPEVGRKYLVMIGIKEELLPRWVVLYVAVVVGIVYLAKNLFAIVEVFYQNFSIQKMSYHFKHRLLQSYAQAEYVFYLTRNSSLGVTIVGGHTELMFSSGLMPLANIVSEGIVFLCLTSMIIFMNPSLALIIMGIGAVLGLIINKVLFPKFYRWGQRLQEATLYGHQTLLQFFHAFKDIVLLDKRKEFINSYQVNSKIKSKLQAIQAAINTLPRITIEILFMGLFVIAIAYLCFKHENQTQMIGTLGGYLYVGFRLMPGLNRIISQLNLFKSATSSIECVYNEYTTVKNQQDYLNIPEFRFEKSIKLNNINFCYPGTPNDSLSNINLEIKRGECVGIIGETGSGKSTLVDIILGLLKPYKGFILIDDQFPVNSYQWHQKVGYVSQSIYLTDDTIEANIAFGEENIDRERLNSAIDAAQLRKFIDHLPNGVKTVVGERGIRLSGGECQRIVIARALYREPEVLIFDEATSALDNETEARLMETIDTLSQNRTVIMIAHRLTTLKNCNRIIKIEKGSILDAQILESRKSGFNDY